MYCSQCGRELKDREVCGCTENKEALGTVNEAEAAEKSSTSQQNGTEASEKSNDSQYAKNSASDSQNNLNNQMNRLINAVAAVFTLLAEIFKNPCTAIQDFMTRDNGKAGIKLMLVKAGAASVFLYFFHEKFIFNTGMLLPAVTVFLLSFGADIVYACIIQISANALYKTDIPITRAREIVGIKSGVKAVGLIVFAICSSFASAIGAFVYILSAIYGYVLSFLAVLQLTQLDKNDRVKLFIFSEAVKLVIFFVFIFALFGSILIKLSSVIFNYF